MATIADVKRSTVIFPFCREKTCPLPPDSNRITSCILAFGSPSTTTKEPYTSTTYPISFHFVRYVSNSVIHFVNHSLFVVLSGCVYRQKCLDNQEKSLR